MGEISALLGKPFFPWQRFVAEVALEVDPETGGPWYETVTVLVQRRSGKTVMIPPVAARVCGQPEPAQVWLTAQKRQNAVTRWREATNPLASLLVPDQASRRIGNMNEELRWRRTDSLFRPFAPDEKSLHGEDPDLVFVDEFWALGLSQYELIREGYAAAWSVKPGQEWLLSAAGTHASTAMKAARAKGRAATLDPRSRTAYFEWCIPETVAGIPVDKLETGELARLIMAHHPRAGLGALGVRLDFVVGEIEKNRTSAIRAYGGLDSDTSESEMVIDANAFRRSTDRARRIPPRAEVAFGLASDPDLRQAAISVAWRDPADGVLLTEVIEVRDQVRWSVPAVVALMGRWPGSAVAVKSDPAGRDLADQLLDEMGAAGVPGSRLIPVTASGYAAACHRLRSGLESSPPRVAHLAERDLRRALQAAEWRQKWLPARGPIAALESHTLAAWGAEHMPEAEPAPLPEFTIR